MCDGDVTIAENYYADQLCANAGWEDVEDDEIWKGSSGKILIVKMPDDYLNNAIAWSKRRLDEVNSSGWEMAPNGADVQIGREVDAMEHKLSLLKEERARRGLTASDPFAPLTPPLVGRKS